MTEITAAHSQSFRPSGARLGDRLRFFASPPA